MNAMLTRSFACLFLMLALSPAVLAGEKVSLQVGMDRMGADYKSFAVPKADAQVCQQACADDAACKAYTYVKPGVKGPAAMCYLKSSVAPATANACCTSGAKGAVAASTLVRWSGNVPRIVVPDHSIADARKAAADKKKDAAYDAKQKELQAGYEQAADAAEQAHFVQQCKVKQDIYNKSKAVYDAAWANYEAAGKVFKNVANAFYKSHPEIDALCASGGCDDAWALSNYPEYQKLLDTQAIAQALKDKTAGPGKIYGEASTAAFKVCSQVKK